MELAPQSTPERNVQVSAQQPNITNEHQQPNLNVTNANVPNLLLNTEEILETALTDIDSLFPFQGQADEHFVLLPPVVFESMEHPFFETKAEILRVLNETWNIYKKRVMDPVSKNTLINPFRKCNTFDKLHVREGISMLINICANWKCQEDMSFNVSKFFYERLEEYVKDMFQEYSRKIMKKSGSALAVNAFNLTRKCFIARAFFKTYFSVLDFGYVPFAEEPIVNDMLYDCYVSEVYDKFVAKVRGLAISQLKPYRKEKMTRAKKRVLKSFKALVSLVGDEKESFIETEWDSFVREDCVAAVLIYLETHKNCCLCEYINAIVCEAFTLNTFCVGNDKVALLLKDLEKITEDRFFGAGEIENACNDDENLAWFPVIHLLEKPCPKAFNSMLKLFGRETGFMDKVEKIFVDYLQQGVMPKFKERIGTDPPPFEFFGNFVSTWDHMAAFLSDVGFYTASNNRTIIMALESPFKLLIDEHAQIFKEQLGLYFDTMLTESDVTKKILRDKSLRDEVKTVVSTIRFVPAMASCLDEFCTRILLRIPRAEVDEKSARMLINPILRSYGHMEETETLKLILSFFAKGEKMSSAFTPDSSSTFHSDGIRVTKATVLQNIEWPEASNVVMKLPGNMQERVSDYKAFLEEKHVDKDCVTNFSYDKVVVSTNAFSDRSRKVILQMSTVQMCILDMFQVTESLTVAEILEKAKPSSDDQGDLITRGGFKEKLCACLRSLMTEQYPILSKTPDTLIFGDQDSVCINSDFKTEERLIDLPLVRSDV